MTGFRGGKFVNLGNAQHTAMYSFFCLNGALDLLYHYHAPLPPNLDYITASVSFAMEAILFSFHLHGRTPMDKQVPLTLIYTGAFSIHSIL